MDQIHPDEAARALAEIGRRRDQVAGLWAIPAWFRWTVVLLAIALATSLDTRIPWMVGVGVTVFVAGMVTALVAVLGRGMRNAPLRRDLLGPRAGLAIVAFVALVLVVNLPTAFILDAANAPYPATIGALAGAVVVVVLGPMVSRYLRRLARR